MLIFFIQNNTSTGDNRTELLCFLQVSPFKKILPHVFVSLMNVHAKVFFVVKAIQLNKHTDVVFTKLILYVCNYTSFKYQV